MTGRARCYDHKDKAEIGACPNCLRIGVERHIVRKTVKALLDAGYMLNVNNGGDGPELEQPTLSSVDIIVALAETDSEHLLVYHGPTVPAHGKSAGWVFFVYGNDGYDVISDYTVNLEPAIQPVLDYAETLSN